MDVRISFSHMHCSARGMLILLLFGEAGHVIHISTTLQGRELVVVEAVSV
jgi:hypothetical protein